MKPTRTRLLFNTWPTFRCAGIKVEGIASDWSSIDVRLKIGRLNRNYVGTAFGGSLSAMSDPFYMFLAMNLLGDEYIVWDKAGQIEFIKPGRGIIRGHYEFTDEEIQALRDETKDGQKYLPWFETDLVDESGDVVAHVRRQLYVRRKDAIQKR